MGKLSIVLITTLLIALTYYAVSTISGHTSSTQPDINSLSYQRARNISNSVAENIIRKIMSRANNWDFFDRPDGLINDHPLHTYQDWPEMEGSYRLTRLEKSADSFSLVVSGKYSDYEYETEYRLMRRQPDSVIFDYALFARDRIEINKLSYLDSYDSSRGFWESPGQSNNLNIGTGGGEYTIRNEGKIFGDIHYCVEKNLSPLPDPGGGKLITVPAKGKGILELTSGRYRIRDTLSISEARGLIINGNVSLYIENDLIVEGNKGIRITENSSLVLFVSGFLRVAGAGFVNDNPAASSLMIFGTEQCREISITGSTDRQLVGAVYAPEALITVSGPGMGLYGALVGREIHLQSNPYSKLHYDEALARMKDLNYNLYYYAVGWDK